MAVILFYSALSKPHTTRAQKNVNRYVINVLYLAHDNTWLLVMAQLATLTKAVGITPLL